MLDIRYENLQPYFEDKLISEQIHPKNPDIRIFNYTQKTQFDQLWDKTTMQCRGLIMNIKTGEILARPFPKFFNYQEHIDKGFDIPSETPIISEKYDGSLGIMYFINGEPFIATRGAFTSDQALWATKYLRENVDIRPYAEKKNLTHLFEIIFHSNRIVVNYPFEGLVYLGSIDIETGAEYDVVVPNGVKRATKTFLTKHKLEDLAKLETPNSEGFVIFFPNTNLRMKVKFAEYVRLHKLVTGVSEIAIWEQLKEGKNLDEFVKNVPDEFYEWVQGVERRLRIEHAKIWGEAQFGLQMSHGKKTRKEKAIYILKSKWKHVSGIIFSLMDGEDKKASQQVWKMVRPNGSNIFKVDADL